jgi:hypothetical protein
MNPIDWIWQGVRIIRAKYLPSYVLMNLLFYGCIAVGMGIATLRPRIQASLRQELHQGVQQPIMSPVTGPYAGGHILRAAAITFAVNLVIGTVAEISVPSLIVPFFGIAFGVFRGVLWDWSSRQRTVLSAP